MLYSPDGFTFNENEAGEADVTNAVFLRINGLPFVANQLFGLGGTGTACFLTVCENAAKPGCIYWLGPPKVFYLTVKRFDYLLGVVELRIDGFLVWL